MGRQSKHRHQWVHNRKFLASIPDTCGDWATTVTFYTALHAAEVLFAHDKIAPHSRHDDRDRTLTFSRYDAIRTSYKVLKNASRVARYDCQDSVLFKKNHIQDTLISKYLKTVEDFVVNEVDPEGKHIQLSPVIWGERPEN